jgi:hypothetical protein
VRRLLVAAGVVLIGVGLRGSALAPDTAPVRVAVLLVVAALLHDLVLAPVAVAAGAVVRHVPGRAREVLQAVGIVGASVVLVAVPVLVGAGRRADNASVLPRDYGRGLALVLLAVVVTAVLAGVVSAVRERRRR